MAKILITNNGPHPAEKWAMTTAEEIFDISDPSAGDQSIQAQKFQLSIAEALAPIHTAVTTDETAKLSKDMSTILTPFDMSSYVATAVKAVVGLSVGSQWEGHFARPEVQDAMAQVIDNHFKTAAYVVRSWQADLNPNDKSAKQFKGA